MKKVLIAEDSSVIQNLTTKILKFQNYEVSNVKNGQLVIEALETQSFDAILMDINMPIMDGMECSKQIRALNDETKSKIPIIVITGNAQNYTKQDFEDAGINAYLQKPLDFDLLVETVKKWTVSK